MGINRPENGQSDEQNESVSAIRAPQRERDNPLTRSLAGMLGIGVLLVMFVACLGTLPITLSSAVDDSGTAIGVPRYDAGSPKAGRLPPSWWGYDHQDIERSTRAIDPSTIESLAAEHGVSVDDLYNAREGELLRVVEPYWPRFVLGSDTLGRSLGARLLAGGGISLTIGLAAAFISVSIGTAYGAFAG